jgi:hypothetical protein
MIDPSNCHRGIFEITSPLHGYAFPTTVSYQAMEPFVAERLRERFGELEGFERHVGITSIRVVHHYLMGGWGMEDTAEPDALFGMSARTT